MLGGIKNMKLERKTIFLYPEINELRKDLFMTTSNLITSIRKIVAISNMTIDRILCGGCFSCVKCKPVVSMQCVGQKADGFSDYSNVRICVAKYGDIDYTENYRSIIDETKNDKYDISHLVALHIYTSKRRIKFYYDKTNQFDAIVETDLEHLDQLLTAIMLDISLYHFFSLSKDLNYRKDFNETKFKYIIRHFSDEELQKIYGESINKDKPIYLPFSMKKVNELSRRINIDNRNEAIRELIYEYGVFLINAISFPLKINCDFYIQNLYEYEFRINKKLIEEIILSLKSDNNFNVKKENVLIIVTDEMTKTPIYVVLEYNHDKTDLTKWLNMLTTDIDKYEIFLLEEKE